MLKVVADSSMNLYQTDLIAFSNVPLKIIGEKEFVDDENLDIVEMVEFFKKSKSRSGSSCPNPEDFLKSYENTDEIIVLTVSSGISGSYQSAIIAKQECPEKKIEVIDSRSAGPELTLLFEKIVELNNQGKSFEEIVEEIHEYQKHCSLTMLLGSLNNFANNGRVSPVVAKAIGILGIRLIGKVSEAGTIEPVTKAKGKKKAIKEFVNQMCLQGYNGGKVIIHHAFNEEGARAIKEEIRQYYPDAKITISTCNGLCSYYLEEGGLLAGFEK